MQCYNLLCWHCLTKLEVWHCISFTHISILRGIKQEKGYKTSSPQRPTYKSKYEVKKWKVTCYISKLCNLEKLKSAPPTTASARHLTQFHYVWTWLWGVELANVILTMTLQSIRLGQNVFSICHLIVIKS